ncbi:Protein HEAT-STRESS-ASSOCIATED 32 [Camellia lanceoleosa]|uniref:Protein HEAT-STRESS-ASSOCIATED 32 n=1 Tax=Camellia lanceoleosa TaxID=1840588 RepID=A0ACC0FS55_9ERIC|nr:Protein HEAT-STRESS-ASSOCIATED 32 [Camellia lanceoleosa]
MEEVIWKEKGEDDATNKMEFPALESMTLSNLPMLIGFCRGIDEIEFPQLKELSLWNLPQLKWLFLNSSNPFSESMENHNATFLSLFPHKVALPSLEQLQLNNLDNLEGLEHIPISVGSFSKRDPIGLKYISQLSILRVHDCNNLRYLFPHSMMKCMLQLQELNIRRCKMMSRIVADGKGQGESSVDKIEFTQLKILRLYDLPNLESFFPKVIATSATSTKCLQNVMRTLFNEKVAFPSLEELKLDGFQNMNEIWCNQLQTGSFNKLFSLCVSDCGSLRNMFSPFMARHLVHLKRLVIIRCSMMEEVVANEEEGGGRINRTPLPKLEYLQLEDVPELKSFCHVTHDWELPLVEHITILKCPKLKTFSPGVICTPKLQRVFVKEGKYKWFPSREGEDWLWISDLNQTISHLIDEDIFESMGHFVDGLKFSGGSHSLMPKAYIKEVTKMAHKHNVYVSTGDWAEHLLHKGPSAFKEYIEECKQLGFDTIELNVGSLGVPEETLLRFI